ncbi:MAG TPA: polysaccharide biosynthesis/export family protein [Planctomycetota bacterium]|nr:polysaccharide biosynthesis/export family protein [Planctomycetota bacterium]
MRLGVAIALLAALAASGCRSSDDARVLQVLNQRGFGRPTQDANRQYYVGIGDTLNVQSPTYPEYHGQSETVRMDGVITLSEVGEVYVNGLSPDEVTAVVRKAYDAYLKDTSGMLVRVMGTKSKRYYVSQLPPTRPKQVSFAGDELLVDAMIKANVDEGLVDTEEILVIRGDPEHPLVIVCNYEDIVQDGLTRDNIQIRENDLIYLTPSIIGWITYGVYLLTLPIQPIANLFTSANQIVTTTESFGEGYGYGYGNKYNYDYND